MEQPEEGKPNVLKKIGEYKMKILAGIIVALAIVCFSLSVFAMYAAVTYFSFIFKEIPNELVAKAYLNRYYNCTYNIM